MRANRDLSRGVGKWRISLGFGGSKNPPLYPAPYQNCIPTGKKESPGTRAGACISASSSGVCWNRCGYIHPAISTALGLTPPSRGYSRASMISSLIRCFSSLSSAVARLRLSRSMSVCIAVASANSQGVSDIPFRRAARAQGRFLVIPSFRYDHGLNRRCPSTRRDSGRNGDC